MARRVFRIAGQRPKVIWKINIDRKKRTIDEAMEIATQNGVQIPPDVEFVEGGPEELQGSLSEMLAGGDMETAKGPPVAEHDDGYVYWADHYNKFGKIRFHIHPDILTSDEGIVATFTHELFELSELREEFAATPKQRMDAGDYGIQIAAGYQGNFHDRAWDAADEAVMKRRQQNDHS
jgi:hypothetical protein